MFDPEKLLGGLLRSGLGSRGTGRHFKSTATMALLGVALEAAEHFMKTTSPSSSRQPPAGNPPPAPPARPRPQAVRSSDAVPPPPPGTAPDQAVRPDPPTRVPEDKPAVLLIRAMIAAAHADGHMDAAERRRILKQCQAVELSADEQAFLSEELLAPASLKQIVRCVADRKQALQVYALSRLVMRVDSEAERQYLQRLAHELNIDAKTIQRIDHKLRSAVSGGRSSTKGA